MNPHLGTEHLDLKAPIDVKKNAFLLCAIFLLVGLQSFANQPIRNVVVILADDHARKVAGCYGNELIRTPNMDRLASEGVLFDWAYCNAPMCSASRASLLTGKYPHTTVANLLFTPFDDSKNTTIAEQLRMQGFKTALFGKNHNNAWTWGELYKDGMPDYGFDVTIEGEQYQQYIKERGKRPVPDSIQTYSDKTDVHNTQCLPHAYYDADAPGTFYANEAARFISENKEKPFFVWYASNEPHSPYAFPIEYNGKYNPADMLLPAGSDEDDRWIPEQFSHLTNQGRKGIIAAYYTSVEFMDKNTGIVLDAITKNGLDNSTLIIYISDNGYLLNDHKRFEKHSMWDEAIHQPLIIKAGNNYKKGVRNSALVEYVDIVPTILDIVNKKPIKEVQGTSLLPVLNGKKSEIKKFVYSFYLEDNFAMVADKRWKYIFHTGARDLGIGYATGKGAAGITHFLYDLENDPAETTNLAAKAEYKEVFNQMRSQLLHHFEQKHPNGKEAPSNLTDDGKLMWFCEPRDIGAMPSLNIAPIRVFYPNN